GIVALFGRFHRRPDINAHAFGVVLARQIKLALQLRVGAPAVNGGLRAREDVASRTARRVPEADDFHDHAYPPGLFSLDAARADQRTEAVAVFMALGREF